MTELTQKTPRPVRPGGAAKLLRFWKDETVLCVSAVLALGSMLLAPPSAAYLDYIDLPVLALLFCLMAVVAGLRSAGLFAWLAHQMLAVSRSAGKLAALLTLLCFVTAALITNDVALITFVPFTVGLLYDVDPRRLGRVVIVETVAANLGSLVTPIGNPQNLFLYSYYGLSLGSFFTAMLPLAGISLGLVLLLCLLLFRGMGRETPDGGEAPHLHPAALARYGALFVLCLLTVLKAIPAWLCLATVVLVLLCRDRGLFRQVDYSLLGTFVCFFIFVGNLSSLEAVRGAVTAVLSGHEMLLAALLSQVVSNVPAAMALAPFTDAARELLWGVNIGGLGTLIASMASLISYRQFCRVRGASRGRYLAEFTLVNVPALALLLGIGAML
jgi:Na+/H+ antiporter NhaD/arsenite permease-like protein